MQVTLPFLAEQLDVGKESLRVAGRLGEVAFHSHASPLTPFWAEIVLPLPKGQGERTPMNAVEIALGKATPVKAAQHFQKRPPSGDPAQTVSVGQSTFEGRESVRPSKSWPDLELSEEKSYPESWLCVHSTTVGGAPSVQFSSVQSLSRVRLCDPMDCSTPGLPVHHQLPEFTQIHVRCVSDAIRPSHPLSSPSPPAFNLSQHQGIF